FGGRTASTVLDDVWALDLTTDTWSRVNVAPGPPARMMHFMVYDSGNDRVILFGGNTTVDLFSQGYAPLDDVWVLDLGSNSWSQVTTNDGPTARMAGGAVWDAQREVMVIYGGQESFSSYFGDLWELSIDGTNGTWTRIDLGTSDGAPTSRFWAPLVHDTVNDRYIVWGGHDLTELAERNDIHVFDREIGQWSIEVEGDTYANAVVDVCAPPADFADIVPEHPERRQSRVMGGGPDGMLVYGGKTVCGVIDDLV